MTSATADINEDLLLWVETLGGLVHWVDVIPLRRSRQRHEAMVGLDQILAACLLLPVEHHLVGVLAHVEWSIAAGLVLVLVLLQVLWQHLVGWHSDIENVIESALDDWVGQKLGLVVGSILILAGFGDQAVSSQITCDTGN